MLAELSKAFDDAIWMFADGIRKIDDPHWKQGPDDYLIPARIAYHLLKSFEWLINVLPREEFLAFRKYKLDWLGPVEPMPGREEMLGDLDLLRQQVKIWLEEAGHLDPAGPEAGEKVAKALYFLRHVQHHIGEYSIIAHLLHCETPEWK